MNSQFLIWLGDIEYKQYKYTLVFGRSLISNGVSSCWHWHIEFDSHNNVRVVEGLAKLQEVSRVRSMQVAFDQYINFEDRGNKFKKIVNQQLNKGLIK